MVVTSVGSPLDGLRTIGGGGAVDIEEFSTIDIDDVVESASQRDDCPFLRVAPVGIVDVDVGAICNGFAYDREWASAADVDDGILAVSDICNGPAHRSVGFFISVLLDE